MEWTEWTWDDCKDWYRRHINGWLLQKLMEPTTFTALDETVLQDSIKIGRNMITLIEVLEKHSEFDAFSKFVSHNVLQLWFSRKTNHLDVSIEWRTPKIYHLVVRMKDKFDLENVSLDEVVVTIEQYFRKLKVI